MDADSEESIRKRNLSRRRSHRYSMDAQRFDEILVEITTGYNNIRSSFENVKIAEILEEIVTEYVRQALETEAAPNFAEVAVLLQHCATLYGRKVDYLYQHVVDVSESLATAEPLAPAESVATPGGTPAKRRRRQSGGAVGAGEFCHIQLSACPAARRGASPPRAPPTLPRMYIELEPRVLTSRDAPLKDYDGEVVGLPTDFHVASTLQNGFLVDELETGGGDTTNALRPLSLVELQAAIAAAAPASPPPSPRPHTPPPGPPAPLCTSTPLPAPLATPPDDVPPTTKHKRKRKMSAEVEDLMEGSLRALITTKVRRRLGARSEFSVKESWVRRVTARRSRALLRSRLLLTNYKEFRGFDYAWEAGGGLAGWSEEEVRAAWLAVSALASGLRAAAPDLDSDDDGFFERSSFSSFESSRTDYLALPDTTQNTTATSGEEVSRRESAAPLEAEAEAEAEVSRRERAAEESRLWSAEVAARAVAGEARSGVDVRALGARVLAALPPAPRALPFGELLHAAATGPQDVSRLLLATLFLANSGNVEISPGPPLTLGEFDLTLVSTDERLYSAAAAADAALLDAQYSA